MSRRAISACFSWSRDLHHTAGSGHLFTQKFRRAVSGTVHHIRWAWVFLACISITGPASLVDAQTHYPPWILVMSEGFEGSFPSAGWSVADLNGGDEHLWGREAAGPPGPRGTVPTAFSHPWVTTPTGSTQP